MVRKLQHAGPSHRGFSWVPSIRLRYGRRIWIASASRSGGYLVNSGCEGADPDPGGVAGCAWATAGDVFSVVFLPLKPLSPGLLFSRGLAGVFGLVGPLDIDSCRAPAPTGCPSKGVSMRCKSVDLSVVCAVLGHDEELIDTAGQGPRHSTSKTIKPVAAAAQRKRWACSLGAENKLPALGVVMAAGLSDANRVLERRSVLRLAGLPARPPHIQARTPGVSSGGCAGCRLPNSSGRGEGSGLIVRVGNQTRPLILAGRVATPSTRLAQRAEFADGRAAPRRPPWVGGVLS